MKIIQKGHLYQLSFMPRCFPINCYFVEEEKSLTLIDAALPYSAIAIIQAAKQIGKPISNILITHAHVDHVGALDKIKESNPDADVYISYRDAKLLAGDLSLMKGEPKTPIRGGAPKNVKTKPNVLLKEGDEVGSLLAIETPGHTPGSMSFFDQRSNAVIVGDAFQTRGGTAVAGQIRLSFPFPAMATWNKGIALESAKKVRKLNPSILAVGHGRLLEEPLEAINRSIEEAERKLVV
ncbi:MBL fold metallo-hydrolase [Bacillus sp. FJAT-47783]|uniref:MBL fold metallo-hydrolase n=1 Tax=Bacillus sp. FJAT-47783 TaxID=2922712 RepID=UPI001FAE45B1|nr:MBL fold metallo-hydrolase [Bacillus sp. FJAT-47783]